jgi:hypothetical protein
MATMSDGRCAVGAPAPHARADGLAALQGARPTRRWTASRALAAEIMAPGFDLEAALTM